MILKLIILATVCMAEIPHSSFVGKMTSCVRSMVSSFYVNLEPLSFLIEKWILKEDLPNFHKVSDGLYRGGQPLGEGYKSLEKQGFKTILNLRAINTDVNHGTDLTYFHIPIHPHRPREQDVVEFLKIVKRSELQPIYLHCFHGSDRTGLFVAIYRMCFEGWTKEDALQEMVHGGYGFHTTYQQNLIHFLRKLDVERIQQVLSEL